jgi:hypothetical protein
MRDYRAEMIKRKQEQEINDAAAEAAISGGSYGALGGGGLALLGGVKSWPKILAAALAGGATAGGFAGGATKIGGEVMGAPDENDDAPYTERAALGGTIAGGLSGAGLGALLASGKLKGLLKYPKIAKLWESAPVKGKVGDWLRHTAREPDGIKRTAATMGALGAGLGGYQGFSEGMGVDAYRNAVKKRYQEMMLSGDL